MFENKTYWLVGASHGLGHALAHALDDRGARLILSARSLPPLQDLAKSLTHAKALALDVTDKASVAEAADKLSNVDGVIYCAGAYDPMSAADWDVDSAEKMADVNFMGALRVLGHVVPDMARRNAGHVVMIGSLAGHRGLPNAIGYGASKAAAMHLAENIRADLRGTDVKVQVINPGFIRTRLTAKNAFEMPQIMAPEDAADRTLKAMQSNRFSTSFPAPFAWLFSLGRILPIKWFQAIFKKNT
ncbi:SDR family NAD(P)-dependent oxidoreductase [Shimia haliotis]|uniref:Short-chain dehydrogenase n=1 Tax=Shimia haliotis TaxID=1280847 RepID=A0A1I4HDJ0_9RHOB|nr:SDR family NAD(P)-dependent oxidoreductase [Shimia haliotis]SFL39737.1 Short-chain dehydrogenase [Shimia haliotis]